MAKQSDHPLRLDRQVCFLLYASSNLVTRLYRPVLAKLGLSYPQYLVMLVLWDSPSQSVGDLGAKLYLDSGTLTPLLKRMETAALLTRRRDPDDERRVLVELTDAGRALRKRASVVPQALAQGLDFDPSAVETLRETLQDIIAMLANRPTTMEK